MSRVRDGLLVFSLLLCGTVAHIYFWCADWYAAMTIWPAWFWLAPGLFLVRAGWRRERRRAGWMLVALWLACVLAYADQPASLLRRPHSRHDVRVVSLNCNGEGDAALEVASVHPDIVFLQESPSKIAVEKLALALRANPSTVICEPDLSVVARGTLQRVKLPRHCQAVRAQVLLESGVAVDIVCLRLRPRPMGDNFLSRELWRAHAAAQQEQRTELSIILRGLPADRALTVGGDFNAPPGDPLYRLMPPWLRDSFREAAAIAAIP